LTESLSHFGESVRNIFKGRTSIIIRVWWWL